MQEQKRYSEEELRYLKLLARQYPTVQSASKEIINLLEVNTTPGMTATSFIPQQVRAAGLDIKDVLTDIIENKL